MLALAALIVLTSILGTLLTAARGPNLERGALVARIDLFEAGRQEMQVLPGIGPKRAARIVDARRVHRPSDGPLKLLCEAGVSEKGAADILRFTRPTAEPTP